MKILLVMYVLFNFCNKKNSWYIEYRVIISFLVQLTEIGQISNFPNNVHVENDIMLDYNYPYEDLPKLKELLRKWGLQCVYQTCVGKKCRCN